MVSTCEVRIECTYDGPAVEYPSEDGDAVWKQTWVNTTAYDKITEREMSRRFTHNRSALAGKRVMLIGAGTLGSLMAQYLVSCGVSNLTIVDMDDYNQYNRPRSVLMRPEDAGCPKALALAKRVAEYSPFSCKIDGIDADITCLGIGALEGFDLVATPVDSGPVRKHVSRWCHVLGIHHVSCGTTVMNRRGGMFATTITVEPTGCASCYEDMSTVDEDDLLKRVSCVDYVPEVQAQVMSFSAAAAGLASQCAINLLTDRFHTMETCEDGSPKAWCYVMSEPGFSNDIRNMTGQSMVGQPTSGEFWKDAGDIQNAPELHIRRDSTIRDIWAKMCDTLGSDGPFDVEMSPTGLLHMAYPPKGTHYVAPVSSLYLDDRDDEDEDRSTIARLPPSHAYLVRDESGFDGESRLVWIDIEGVE